MIQPFGRNIGNDDSRRSSELVFPFEEKPGDRHAGPAAANTENLPVLASPEIFRQDRAQSASGRDRIFGLPDQFSISFRNRADFMHGCRKPVEFIELIPSSLEQVYFVSRH